MAAPDRFRKLDRDHWDVIVVGAGISGLTTAALLARRGLGVLLVDQHYVPGGNATIFKRPGYEFDVGLHYIGQCEGGLFPRVLADAGAQPVRFRPMDPDAFDTVVLPNRELGVPRGIERYRLRLLEAFPAERTGIDRYVSFLAQQKKLEPALSRPSRLPGVLLTSPLLLRYGTGTLGAFLDSCTRDPELRTVLAAESGDYAEPPSRASLALHAGLMLHYLDEGGFYPEGGGQVMSDRLADAIEQHGGKILLSTRVTRILVEAGRAVGVRVVNKHLGEREIRAPRVVAGSDIKKLYLDLLGPDVVSQKTIRKVRSWEMAPALGMVYLGVRREALAGRTRNTNYWIYGSTDLEGAYADTRAGRVSRDPMAYISIASLKDPENPRVAPPGMVNLQVMGLAPCAPEAWGVSEADVVTGKYRDNPVYLAKKRAYTDALLGTAERVFPNLRQHVVFEETATPLTHTRYTLSTGGTSYGLALIPEQFLWRRPGPKTELEGLYLCGASLITGHGIAGAMASGVNAAAAILGKQVWSEVRRARPGALEARRTPPSVERERDPVQARA
ncbi:MAG: NAD(P)/FAD-dependent oxidoreductase [Myxococcales bacterium]|nr:NAD(P)/FAD-dependent oxidoreductase [Myxococcales bacterium]